MMLPEVRREKREQRDRQEDADERRAPNQSERSAVQMRGVACRGRGMRRGHAKAQGYRRQREHCHEPDRPADRSLQGGARAVVHCSSRRFSSVTSEGARSSGTACTGSSRRVPFRAGANDRNRP